MSRPRARALSILHPVHALEPELFALYMWPASPSWGSRARGRGAWLRARGFLASLEADGLIARHSSSAGDSSGYVVTPEGERLASGAPCARARRSESLHVAITA